MPRYNVEADGKWACFSTVVDDFITPFMDRPDYEEWRQDQYGRDNVPIEQANQMSLTRALRCWSLYHTDEEILLSLRECGLMHSREDLAE
jgi:hypothetical protein